MSPKDRRVQKSFSIPLSLIQDLEVASGDLNLSHSALATLAITELLARINTVPSPNPRPNPHSATDGGSQNTDLDQETNKLK